MMIKIFIFLVFTSLVSACSSINPYAPKPIAKPYVNKVQIQQKRKAAALVNAEYEAKKKKLTDNMNRLGSVINQANALDDSSAPPGKCVKCSASEYFNSQF